MPSQNTYHLTWVSLTLDMGYLHGCSSKVQLLLFTLDEVTCDDLECGVAPLGPPRPHSHCSLDVGLLLSGASSDLGHVMTNLDSILKSGDITCQQRSIQVELLFFQ